MAQDSCGGPQVQRHDRSPGLAPADARRENRLIPHIGTSGWQYRDWRGRFYPQDLPQSRWLPFYSDYFDTVEVNNTFYHLPEAETFKAWRGEVPSRFEFTLKVSRYLTHIKRLKDPKEPVDRFLRNSRPLATKRGPFLLQLPPSMEREVGRLEETLAAFGRNRMVAVEFRHASWFAEEVYSLLEGRNVPMVWSNRGGRWLEPQRITADWSYIRMHEGRAANGGYGTTSIRSLAELLSELPGKRRHAYVYFNNDHMSCAPANALSLKARFE